MNINEAHDETFDEQKRRIKQIRENREELKSLLAEEKVRLIFKLGEKFGLNNVRDYGACGRTEFGLRVVDIKINCKRKGGPCHGTGHATSPLLSAYYWIPIVCTCGNADFRYMVALHQQDIDLTTGNFHEVFGVVQIWRGLEESEGCEIGGEINESLGGHFPEDHRVLFNAQKAFPPAVRCGGSGTVTNPGEKPWGIQWDADAWGTIPKTFDMGSSDYRTEDIARFATNLIIADFTANLKK